MLDTALIAETPNLEELRANGKFFRMTQQCHVINPLFIVTEGALRRWIPGLPRLKSINLWDGDALRNTGREIGTHCHSFAILQFWSW